MDILPKDMSTFLLGDGKSTNIKGGKNSVCEHIGSRSPAGLHPVFLDAIMQYCGLLITQ